MQLREGKLVVSATDLVGFLECGYLTELERAAAAGLVEKPIREDPEIELLQRRGAEHEKRYIAQLKADGRQISDLTAGPDVPLETRARQTMQAMQRGDDVIYQATLFDGTWRGHPDFLLRVPRASGDGPPRLSRFDRSLWDGSEVEVIQRGDPRGTVRGSAARRESGQLGNDWHYEVADTKLAHSTRASALLQICSYVDQLQKLQDKAPERVHVVLGGAEITTESFRTAELMAYYRNAERRFEKAIDDAQSGAPQYPIPKAMGYPDPVEHCGVCRWSFAVCKPTWRRDDALALVANITRSQRVELRGQGVETRGALAQSDLKGFETVIAQARLQVASDGLPKPAFAFLEPESDSDGRVVADRGLSALPLPAEGDLFFDIEGDPFAFNEGLDYLFGIWDGAEYRTYWAKNRAEEKVAFQQVVDLFAGRLERYPNFHVYHYASYEPSALKRLAGRHATREEELDRLLRGRVFVDLYRVVRQGLLVGTEGYSIKDLEPLYDFGRTIDLRTAGKSIVEFEAWLETGQTDDRLLDEIEAYNKDDCVSTELLRNWLEARRPEVERRFGLALPRPPREVPEEPADVLSVHAQAVADTILRLTAGIDKDPAKQPPTDRTTWLLANLLDWHRREEKAAWWRFFELMALSDDELFEEDEPIGHLRYEGDLGTNKAGKVIHRYRFDPQEHKVGDRSELHNPALPFPASELGTGKIDKDNLTLDITRPPDWTGPHPTSIVPFDRIPIAGLQQALLRVGNWVADNGFESESGDYQAVRDLLVRRTPRAGQPAGEWLVNYDAGETGQGGALRLAIVLDGTTLPIQGPPGSGKTTSGTQMILELVRAGKRVGITGPSHKVVSNLLVRVARGLEGASPGARAIQRVDGDDATDHPLVAIAKDNGKCDRLLADSVHRVIAGTPWLWAREQMAGSIDTLFVDEAGQLSLANVVAMGGAARNIVLLGDPQQLDQVLQGSHPPGAEKSALGHYLGNERVVAPANGVFLERTHRMHPQITKFTSDLFYEAELRADPELSRQAVLGDEQPPEYDWLTGSGLRWLSVRHDGNTNESVEEADRVCEIWNALIGRSWIDAAGTRRELDSNDIVIVSPFNAHRLLLAARLPGARIGTVDKFQGQEAPVSIYTMATSRPDDAPRGLSFLFSLNRLNVATSRARALTIVVASPRLLAAVARTPDQLRMVNGLCAFVEEAAAGLTSREAVPA